MAASRVTWSKFRTDDPQILGATVQRFRRDLCSLKKDSVHLPDVKTAIL